MTAFAAEESGAVAREVAVGAVRFANNRPLALLAGPCVLEGESFAEAREFALRTAGFLTELAHRLALPLVYKASFDKANRSSESSYRGPGLQIGLQVLECVRREFAVPVVTDVHEIAQAQRAAEVVDLLQTPAFLCRQTDFIQAVARTGRPVNIKKGQFLAPEGMAGVARKALAAGNEQILLCERGYAFGYGNLVVDMRSLVIMAKSGFPIIFDATHAVQLPGGMGESSGGERQFVAPLARAAVAVGVAGIFLETHPDPDHAPCDGPNMVPFSRLSDLLQSLQRLDEVQKG
ncbi:3-deoxy-8-phosphooctulonate synthase [Candidatus Magnetaquicoccus inordinatus]|uniref:3-deoxy-8-phosphooctulonate synthase n=1 Tax=Candidatus Magnetaquicoccus inordinatus TaxID=2496818 RepID=UPI00102D061B|nr:3-deoxy-8-phosphooctulonate synthase [Candidatus Magnetaquicoccus inordinatus]